MPRYSVMVEVAGSVYMEVEAESEDAAVREARRLAELGEGSPRLDFQVVGVTEAREQ